MCGGHRRTCDRLWNFSLSSLWSIKKWHRNKELTAVKFEPRPKKSLLFHQTYNKALEDFWWVSEKKREKYESAPRLGLLKENWSPNLGSVHIFGDLAAKKKMIWQEKKGELAWKRCEKKKKKQNWHGSNRETMPWYKNGDGEVIIVWGAPRPTA